MTTETRASCLHSSKVKISEPMGQPLAPTGSLTYCCFAAVLVACQGNLDVMARLSIVGWKLQMRGIKKLDRQTN
jgi:hypothetical protein